MESMSEDEGQIDLEQVPDALKAYKQQLDALKEDVEVLTMFANVFLIGQVRQYVEGNPGAKPDVKEKCVKFLQRHGSLTKD
jgi:hypothetical protein